jgi:SAM-dependent methyltransferase
MELDPSIRAYYEKGEEAERLSGGFPSGPLELARTKEIVLRYLPSAGPLDIVDVGGGPGVYAKWLVELGHRVHLIDPIELHVEQAGEANAEIQAAVGDARELPRPDDSADVVFLLGPLYHLTERQDRMKALSEARRVLRGGGLLIAAGISRFASLLDLLLRLDRLHEPEAYSRVESVVRTGTWPPGGGQLFTTAYFHLARDLAEEVAEAGFESVTVLPVEGPGAWVTNFEERWSDPIRRELLMEVARWTEGESEIVAASAHLICVGVAAGS